MTEQNRTLRKRTRSNSGLKLTRGIFTAFFSFVPIFNDINSSEPWNNWVIRPCQICGITCKETDMTLRITAFAKYQRVPNSMWFSFLIYTTPISRVKQCFKRCFNETPLLCACYFYRARVAHKQFNMRPSQTIWFYKSCSQLLRFRGSFLCRQMNI